MLESRNSYGWGGTSSLSSDQVEKWQVAYRSEYGNYGEIGYKLFDTYEQAEAFAAEFKAKTSWVKDTIIKHPSKIFSNY